MSPEQHAAPSTKTRYHATGTENQERRRETARQPTAQESGNRSTEVLTRLKHSIIRTGRAPPSTRPGIGGPRDELFPDIHLVPRDLVYPDHGTRCSMPAPGTRGRTVSSGGQPPAALAGAPQNASSTSSNTPAGTSQPGLRMYYVPAARRIRSSARRSHSPGVA